MGTPPPLPARKCKPCEGGTTPLPESAARALLQELRGWELMDLPAPPQLATTIGESATLGGGHVGAAQAGGKAIHKTIVCKNFLDAVQLIQRIAPIAEAEDHHPNLHLTRYKRLTVELSTHAIGGLSENDFIVAAKIDQLLA